METGKNTSAKSAKKSAAKPAAAVVIPASTSAGVVREPAIVDMLTLGDHQNNNLAGDIAAAEVTRPVAVAGAIVEPVNPALASEPLITGDAAGDAAIAEVAGTPVPATVQPFAVATETGEAIVEHEREYYGTLHNPERSTTAVEVGTGDTASPAAGDQTLAEALNRTSCETFEELVEMALLGNSLMVSIDVVTAVGGPMPGWTPAEDPAEIVLDMAELLEQRTEARRENRVALDEALGGDYSQIRITAKIAGFRRAGKAHPAHAVEYDLDDFTPDQVRALLDEPQLVIELI